MKLFEFFVQENHILLRATGESYKENKSTFEGRSVRVKSKCAKQSALLNRVDVHYNVVNSDVIPLILIGLRGLLL